MTATMLPGTTATLKESTHPGRSLLFVLGGPPSPTSERSDTELT